MTSRCRTSSGRALGAAPCMDRGTAPLNTVRTVFYLSIVERTTTVLYTSLNLKNQAKT